MREEDMMDERYTLEPSPLIESSSLFLEDSFINPDPEIDEPSHGPILLWENGDDHHSTGESLLEMDSESHGENPLFESPAMEGPNVELHTSPSSPRSMDTMEAEQAY